MKRFLPIIIGLITIQAFGQNKPNYKEPFRPQFHFTPYNNWMNDPNGLVYYKGEYHLFYQFNPMGNTWGHMSWGHAVSPDLIHWQPLPIAIPEDDKNMIFSGSCVVDKDNTSGFATKGQTPMVAIYTAHNIPDKSKTDNYTQSQFIAYSLDDGRTWQKYANNPVLDAHKKDFRDPKVFWYENGKKWIMTVALPTEHKVQFYGSADLKSWSFLSDFGPTGETNGIWECPDLVQVPVSEDITKTKWVLFVSEQNTMQYFVGEFDGNSFKNENPESLPLRPDYGPDFFAGVTFNNVSSRQDPILMGWANNWSYGQSIPTSPWRGAMGMPRTLQLTNPGYQWILLQQPIKAVQQLRGKAVEWKNEYIVSELTFPAHEQTFEMDVEATPTADGTFGIQIAEGNGKQFTIAWDGPSKKMSIDRMYSGNISFSNDFNSWLYKDVYLPLQGGKLRFHIFFDKSIIEIFANDGSVVMTAQVFPDPAQDGIKFFSKNGTTKVNYAKLWPLKSAWQ